jgi:hypothetical protein
MSLTTSLGNILFGAEKCRITPLRFSLTKKGLPFTKKGLPTAVNFGTADVVIAPNNKLDRTFPMLFMRSSLPGSRHGRRGAYCGTSHAETCSPQRWRKLALQLTG